MQQPDYIEVCIRMGPRKSAVLGTSDRTVYHTAVLSGDGRNVAVLSRGVDAKITGIVPRMR